VVEAFRGVTTRSVDVETGAGGGDCGYRFRVGSTYFVDASRTESTGALTVSSCSMTRPIEAAFDEIAFARAAFVNNVPLGRVGGTVTFVDRNFDDRPEPRRPAGGIPVRVERSGERWTTTTDPSGEFAVEGLPAGRYDVSFDVPDGQHARLHWDIVDLPDPRGCADASASIGYDGRIGGRVVDGEGRAVSGLTLDLAAARRPRSPRLRATTDDEGRFEFAEVPAGAFVIGVNMDAEPGRPASPRYFHPGVSGLDQAERIVLKGGERRTLDDLVLPREARPTRIAGIVVAGDGMPAAGVRVFLKSTIDDRIIGEPVKTSSAGTFAMTAFGGGEYEVFAEDDSNRERLAASDAVRFIASSDLPPFRLVLRRRY
jgi:hypothetical protein